MFVSAFRGSWAGWTSRDVVRVTEMSIFVEFNFRCCMRMWSFMVARYFGKYSVMRQSVRPGQDKKWLSLMARIKVYGRGPKAHPWRKAAG